MSKEDVSAGGYRPHSLLTIEQAAAEFNVSKRHLRSLRSERRVRSYVVAQRVMFRWIDLHEYLESLASPARGARR